MNNKSNVKNGSETEMFNDQEENIRSKSESDEDLIILMKKRANLKELQVENKKMEKELNRLRKSKKWKYSAPIRKLLYLKTILNPTNYKALVEEKKALQLELIKVKEELFKSQEKNELEKERYETLLGKESERIHKEIKGSKEDGSFFEYIDKLIFTKRSEENKYNKSLEYAAKLYKSERNDYKHLAYNNVLKGLKLEDVPEFIVRETESNNLESLNELASFRALLTLRLIKRQLGEHLPEWELDHKLVAYNFVDNLGLKRPWRSDMRYEHHELPLREGIVIKPLEGAGSRGVYLVFQDKKIQDIRRSRVLKNFEELKESMKKDLSLNWVYKDEWIIEELIMEDINTTTQARDIKFYCFYGKVALVLEIVRFPELRYCWWLPTGETISTGKYEDNLFVGSGISDNEIKMAADLSIKIPAPFIRIDFLRSDGELVFGEFTPKPGNYDEFNNNIDVMLGQYFLDAESRLYSDLLSGKIFSQYNNFYQPKK
ncbi:ATP-grasp fold amidoligase family protein [Evansella tamaricis]|uniref:Teichuronopeptide biosynthesis n=1 Tax=Evansella tamaricis TaxID=2069301 RepID=A0ABS6JHU4_9BACI|nr:ATP-grasp fold amidoligase family protein [Evansella tamaricis]MBU9712950.1 teichuronopeptide biosynthesis [Evansella tamaricis]